MSDTSFDTAQRALRNRAVVDLEEPLPDEQPTRWWLRIVVLLVFLTFGAIVWLSWRDNAGNGEPVLVEAPPGPIKEKPIDPGGMTPRNTDTEIASTLGSNDGRDISEPPPRVSPPVAVTPPARPMDEDLLPAKSTATSNGNEGSADIRPASANDADATPDVATDEGPDTPDVIASSGADVAPSPAAGPSETKPKAITPASGTGISSQPLSPIPGAPAAPTVTVPKVPEPPRADTANLPRAVVPAIQSSSSAASIEPTPPATVKAESMIAPAPAVAAPKQPAAPIPPKPTVPPAKAVDLNLVRIQVGSLRDKDAANVAWERAAKKNPDLFRGKSRMIIPADVRGTTYYRAQLAGFANQAAAEAACGKVQRNGGDCLVVAP